VVGSGSCQPVLPPALWGTQRHLPSPALSPAAHHGCLGSAGQGRQQPPGAAQAARAAGGARGADSGGEHGGLHGVDWGCCDEQEACLCEEN
jgi:hypothetical protein